MRNQFFPSQDHQEYLTWKNLDFRGTDTRLSCWDNFGYGLKSFFERITTLQVKSPILVKYT